ncbi:aspartyl-phosphate phosphatase Spo0E family protein [Tissierella sp. MSJ-40]|uniref:Aspartyl-phosphate phosphatase Spo0E family protein n=1 Tax=Tissierella simiarum TaxID=2841534 RepID=A0ABS6E3I5_9FIRM|nr:aspartyl-phosphate phosphatase Spo0E family protein [Tissierella simiarum]MBU5437136.1 aspartyl-phosphate phosphatase Spo0E family protein [Tissierella simiarum]
MTDKNLYKEKGIKEIEKDVFIEDLKHLKREIEMLRSELNKEVIEGGKGISDVETIKLSQRLDELIARYLKGISEMV